MQNVERQLEPTTSHQTKLQFHVKLSIFTKTMLVGFGFNINIMLRRNTQIAYIIRRKLPVWVTRLVSRPS